MTCHMTCHLDLTWHTVWNASQNVNFFMCTYCRVQLSYTVATVMVKWRDILFADLITENYASTFVLSFFRTISLSLPPTREEATSQKQNIPTPCPSNLLACRINDLCCKRRIVKRVNISVCVHKWQNVSWQHLSLCAFHAMYAYVPAPVCVSVYWMWFRSKGMHKMLCCEEHLSPLPCDRWESWGYCPGYAFCETFLCIPLCANKCEYLQQGYQST